jgi:hypothetical protein
MLASGALDVLIVAWVVEQDGDASLVELQAAGV